MKALPGALLLGVASVLLGAVAAALHPRAPEWFPAPSPHALAPAEALRAIGAGGWIVLDARPRAEFEAARIAGAVRFDETDWEAAFVALLDAWDPDRPILVYCGEAACGLSRAIAERLSAELGLPPDRVRYLDGGWESWTGPVERGGQP